MLTITSIEDVTDHARELVPEKPVVPWSCDEHETALRKMHDDPRYSYARIADELSLMFGVRFTRNAVVGKSNRIGLQSATRKTYPPRKKKEKPERTIAVSRRKLPPVPLPVCTAVEGGVVGGVSLLERTARQCCYPVSGEGIETRYCGAERFHNRPYCVGHANVCLDRARMEQLDRKRKMRKKP